MTAEPALPSITCPSSLVASCGPLLGFEPENCLVMLIHGVPGRPGPVALCIDLASPGTTSASLADELVALVASIDGVMVDLVAWADEQDATPRESLSTAWVLARIIDGLEGHSYEVREALTTNGRVWWSHVCGDPQCCPAAGGPLDPDTVTRVRAEYAFAGVAPLPSRAAIGERLARDESLATRVGLVVRRRRPPRNREAWRDRQVRVCSALLVPTRHRVAGHGGLSALPATPIQIADLVSGLADIRVRDTVLRRLIVSREGCPDCWALTIERLTRAVQGAPVGSAAPVATILALVAWMRGEGALATFALGRAADEDPDYTLAELARRVIGAGMDPRAWAAALGTLSEAECRHGAGF